MVDSEELHPNLSRRSLLAAFLKLPPFINLVGGTGIEPIFSTDPNRTCHAWSTPIIFWLTWTGFEPVRLSCMPFVNPKSKLDSSLKNLILTSPRSGLRSFSELSRHIWCMVMGSNHPSHNDTAFTAQPASSYGITMLKIVPLLQIPLLLYRAGRPCLCSQS